MAVNSFNEAAGNCNKEYAAQPLLMSDHCAHQMSAGCLPMMLQEAVITAVCVRDGML